MKSIKNLFCKFLFLLLGIALLPNSSLTMKRGAPEEAFEEPEAKRGRFEAFLE